jgi:hypothetical protein
LAVRVSLPRALTAAGGVLRGLATGVVTIKRKVRPRRPQDSKTVTITTTLRSRAFLLRNGDTVVVQFDGKRLLRHWERTGVLTANKRLETDAQKDARGSGASRPASTDRTP